MLTILWASQVAAQSTYFAEATRTFAALNANYYQNFTVSGSARFQFRFVSDYAASAAIIDQSYLNSFRAGNAVPAYSSFNNQYGYEDVTLGAGSYSIVMRSNVSSSNTARYELDYRVSFSDAQYEDRYFSGTKIVGKNGGKVWQSFSIQSGFRYWVDGCNTGLDCYVIDASELSRWQNGSSFSYYTAYSGVNSVDLPGGYELNLPAGDYYLVFKNNSTVDRSLQYVCERWRKNGSSSSKNTWTAYYTYAGTLYNYYVSIGSYNLAYGYYYLYYGYGEYYRYKGAANTKRAAASYWWFYATFAYFYYLEYGDYASAIDAYNTYVAYAYKYF